MCRQMGSGQDVEQQKWKETEERRNLAVSQVSTAVGISELEREPLWTLCR